MSLEQLRQRERRSGIVSAGFALGGTALATLLSIASGNPAIGSAAVGGIVVMVALAIWVWRQPVRGAYVLFGAAVLLAAYSQTGLTDYIGQYLPFFQDVNTITHSKALAVSPGELFMTLTLMIWLLKGIAERNLRFDRGSLMVPIALYILLVLVGEVHGVTSGGDFRTSLWELRSQAYMLVAYIFVCNLVKTRSQVTKLLWILLIGAGLRGIEATYQYVFKLRAVGLSSHELYPHEQSYFFNGFLTLTLILFLYGGPRRMKRVALWLLPFVIIGELANNRRGAIAALCIALLALCFITWIAQPRRRRAIGWSLLVLAAILPPYYIHYQDQSGFLALPARAISSSFHPSANDAASDQYRVFEDRDIMATVKASPLVGYGFGKPMLTPYPLPDIGYVFQYIMPHNSILWVWMRLGTIGYMLLWFLIGAAIVQATRLVRHLRDPALQGLALFILLMVIQQVIISYVDLQWSNYRTMITTGVLFALLSRLTVFAAAGQRPSLPARRALGRATKTPRNSMSVPQPVLSRE